MDPLEHRNDPPRVGQFLKVTHIFAHGVYEDWRIEDYRAFMMRPDFLSKNVSYFGDKSKLIIYF